jgi:chemotaxis protein MotA
MEMTTILGLIIGIGGIILGNVIEGGHLGSLVQGAAAVIVFSGTFGAVILSSKKRDLKLGLKMARQSFIKTDENKQRVILDEILDSAKVARKESILAIEAKVKQMSDPFLRSVIQSVVDGVDPQIIRSIYEKQIDLEEEKLNAAARIWMDAGGFAPTVGIIGAVLGLIHVMGNLSDTSKLGAGIAVAFVATIYGVASANLIFIPLANKLKKTVQDEIRVKEMILEGGLAILSGLTPSLIEIKLKSFLETSEHGS